MSKDLQPAELWHEFAARHQLTDSQVTQYQRYYTLVRQANELFNLTAITQLSTFITHHLDDSLALGVYYAFHSVQRIADIGTGAGFPGIPLKIKYPHLAVTFIEVTHKKVLFLQEVIEKLGLSEVTIVGYDWRTFLRNIHYPIDLFCARASLQPAELLRMFKPSSPYKSVPLVYWASAQWEPPKAVAPYITEDLAYTVGHKRRRLIVLKNRSDITTAKDVSLYK